MGITASPLSECEVSNSDSRISVRGVLKVSSKVQKGGSMGVGGGCAQFDPTWSANALGEGDKFTFRQQQLAFSIINLGCMVRSKDVIAGALASLCLKLAWPLTSTIW